MKKLLSIVILLCFSHFLQAQLLINEEEVILQTDKGSLVGTLRDPGEKAPVVLIIAGSGPTDRNGNNPMGVNCDSYKLLAEGLYIEGIATLCFDKRGIGASAEAMVEEKDVRFEHMVEDVKGWIDLLAADERFSSVIIAGHSEGSLVGMLAAKDNRKVEKYISLSGVAVSADELLKEQLMSQPEPVRSKIFEVIDQLKAGEEVPGLPPFLDALFRTSVQPYLISWFRYVPTEELKALNQPVLIVQGTTDIQVSESQATLLHAAKPSAKLLLVEGMNHVLKNCPSMDQVEQMKTYQDPSLPLPSELLKTMVLFIK